MAKFYFYYSSMNAGKSTALLQSSHNYRERGMSTLLLCPALDNRYGQGRITSRLGIEEEATTFAQDEDLYQLVAGYHNNRAIHCVMIDEAQFLKKNQVYQLGRICD